MEDLEKKNQKVQAVAVQSTCIDVGETHDVKRTAGSDHQAAYWHVLLTVNAINAEGA